jgi:hypothetical protein
LQKFLANDAYSYPSATTRFFRGLSAVSLNSLRVLLRKGPAATQSFVASCHHVHAGYGMPKSWATLPWRENLAVPKRGIDQLFPEIDFTDCPSLVFPISRDLGISTEELAILCRVANHIKPRRVIEFGTAEGRTAVNLARHLADEGEVVTLDFSPIAGQNDVGFFYWNHPAKAKIKQISCSVIEWDSRPYENSAEIVFCDACDLMPGLAAELFQAITTLKPGGVIFRHDYGSVAGTTLFWNWVASRLPVFHIEGTTLLCLRLNNPEVFQKAQSLLDDPILKDSVKLPRAG